MRRSLLLVAAGLLVVLCFPSSSFAAGPTVEQLASVQARHEASIMALAGVIAVGIGKENDRYVFVVLVDRDEPLPSLPASIEGMPVVWRRSPRIVTHHGGAGCTPCHANQLPLPTPMGQSTSNTNLCYACSLGFKVCDPNAGVLGYVTNNHCNADVLLCENGSVGIAHVERAALDNDCILAGPAQCGTSERIVLLAAIGNRVDAAFIRSSSAQSSQRVRDIGNPRRQPGTVRVGDCIRKSGRTTGLTFGRVTMVNVTVDVEGYCDGVRQFIEQIVYVADRSCGRCSHPGGGDVPCPISLAGDSGSPVLRRRKIVGLHFAGSEDGGLGIGNTVQNVLSALGVTLDLRNCSLGAPEPAERADD